MIRDAELQFLNALEDFGFRIANESSGNELIVES